MRLWHYKLIPYLPNKQLVSQWRELIAIKGKIEKNGSPNHSIVNRVLEYPIEHFKDYSLKVYLEMQKRGYSPNAEYLNSIMIWDNSCFRESYPDLMFYEWHTNRYLKQCLLNLEEKYDCGSISINEWVELERGYFYIVKGSF